MMMRSNIYNHVVNRCQISNSLAILYRPVIVGFTVDVHPLNTKEIVRFTPSLVSVMLVAFVVVPNSSIAVAKEYSNGGKYAGIRSTNRMKCNTVLRET